MICQVCKEDHRTLVNKEWCDRSLLEIENDYLKAENARLREALEFYADEAAYGYHYNSEKESVIDVIADSGDIAREALKGVE
jgi:hypothetical protein